MVTSLEELRSAINTNRIAVMGGLMPGVSTDAISMIACEMVNSKVMINVSREKLIYDRNPREKGARKQERLTHDGLVQIASRFDSREAGSNFLFDLLASKLAKRGGNRDPLR